MRSTFTVNHNEHVSNRSFEEVISAFESAVGSVEDTGFPALLASTKSAEEFEASVQSRAGSSGFMRCFHGRSRGLVEANRIEGPGRDVHDR